MVAKHTARPGSQQDAQPGPESHFKPFASQLQARASDAAVSQRARTDNLESDGKCGRSDVALTRSFVHGPPSHDVEHRTPLLLEHDVCVPDLGDQHRIDKCLRVRRWIGENRLSLIGRTAVAKLGAESRERQLEARFGRLVLAGVTPAHGHMVGLPRLSQRVGMSPEAEPAALDDDAESLVCEGI